MGEDSDWIFCRIEVLSLLPPYSVLHIFSALISLTWKDAYSGTMEPQSQPQKHCCEHRNSTADQVPIGEKRKKRSLSDFLHSQAASQQGFWPSLGPCFFLSWQFLISSTPPALLAAKQIWQNLVNFSSHLILRSQWELTVSCNQTSLEGELVTHAWP